MASRARKVAATLFAFAFAGTLNFCRAQPTPDQDGDVVEEVGDQVELDFLTADQIKLVHAGIDRNKDGGASMAEVLEYSTDMRKKVAKADIKTIVAEMDTDNNGALSLEEVLKDIAQWVDDGTDEQDKAIAAERKAQETEKFQAADENKDGQLDVNELPSLFYPETHDGVITITTRATLADKDKDRDGLLTPMEFWEGDVVDDQDLVLSEEEKKDFVRLDKDKSGKLDLEELKVWESGLFQTEEAMRKLFEIADADNNMHITHDELHSAREAIAGTDAQYHLMEWAEHIEL